MCIIVRHLTALSINCLLCTQFIVVVRKKFTVHTWWWWSRTCIVFLNEWIDSFPRWPYSFFLVFITLLNDILRINSNFGLQLDKIRWARNTTHAHAEGDKEDEYLSTSTELLAYHTHTNWTCLMLSYSVILICCKMSFCID